MKKAQFEFYKDALGEWRWRLKTRNGRTVADSAEGYTTKAKCVGMARKVCSVASDAQEVTL